MKCLRMNRARKPTPRERQFRGSLKIANNYSLTYITVKLHVNSWPPSVPLAVRISGHTAALPETETLRTGDVESDSPNGPDIYVVSISDECFD